MSIYDVDYNTFVPNMLPPNKRLPRFMQLLRDYLVPLQWNHDNFFQEYADGSPASLWSSLGVFAPGDRTISWYPFDTNINYITNANFTAGDSRSNTVYECQVAGQWPVLVPPHHDHGTGAVLTASLNTTGNVGAIGIKDGGSGYGQAAWLFFIGGGGSNSLALLNYDGNLVTSPGAHLIGTSVSSIDPPVALSLGGTSVQPTAYIVPPTVILFSLSGSGAKAVPTLDINGTVNGFSIVSGGTGYATPPAVIIFGGTTRGAGTITNVEILFPGTGYTSAPQVLVGSQWETVAQDFRGARHRAEYNSGLGMLTWIMNEWFHTTFRNFNPIGGIGLYGWGTGGGATAHVSAFGGGVITAVTVDTPGSGYAEAPIVAISDPTGSGATAYVTLTNGAVTSIGIATGGAGYTAPVVTLLGGGTGAFQQAHSDIFITTLTQVGNIFYVGNIEVDSSYVVNIETDSSIPFLQYIQGDNGGSLYDFVIWVPNTYWTNIAATDDARRAIFRNIADQYVLAGLNYTVLPY